MLFEKRYAPELSDIVLVKLLNGDEIIGKVAGTTIGSIVLSRPFNVIVQRVNAQEVVQGFAPVYSAIEHDSRYEIEIPFSAMAIKPIKAGAQATTSYIEATIGLVTNGGGIITP